MSALRNALAGLLGVAAACVVFVAVAMPLASDRFAPICGRPCIIRSLPHEVTIGTSSAHVPRGPGRGYPIGPCGPFLRSLALWRFEPAAFAPPELGTGIEPFTPDPSRILLAGSDGEHCGAVIPLRAMPEWPEDAEHGGSVVLALDISERGLPENVRVIDAAPRGVFEHAALEAVEGWRYCPVIRDGQPVVRPDVHVRLRFERKA
jgi:TonB family protein